MQPKPDSRQFAVHPAFLAAEIRSEHANRYDFSLRQISSGLVIVRKSVSFREDGHFCPSFSVLHRGEGRNLGQECLGYGAKWVEPK